MAEYNHNVASNASQALSICSFREQFCSSGRIISRICMCFSGEKTMKIEKKLVAYSVIALLIGIASITPLMLLMTAKAETTPKPWFNLDVPYAYLKANFTENLDGRDIYSDWHAIVLNYTLNPEAENEIFDARFEYFELQVYTDKETVWN